MRSISPIVTLIFLFILASAMTALPDEWGPPSEFDAFSENHHYVAHITPAAKKQEKPRMEVFAVKGKDRSKRWSAELSNSTCPIHVFVADSGEYVVTTDNYFGIGYGDDVVAFYGKAGQIKKYSLEQIFPELNSPIDAMKKFKHSTLSRWWNEGSILFFDVNDQDLSFCIWVAWADKWVAWNVRTGEQYTPSFWQKKRWNAKARDMALQRIKAGEADSAEFKFLGKLKHSEDRALIEQLLNDSHFNTGSISSEGSKESGFTYRSHSQKRQMADQILARWDRLVKDDEESLGDDRYYRLGVVKMSVTFPQAPRPNEGLIRVYLIPGHLDAAHWNAASPDQYLLADLEYNFPTGLIWGANNGGKLDKEVNFRIDGVTPGKYWIKVIWNKEKPRGNREEVLVRPTAGDHVSKDSPMITVEAGKVLEDIRINCTELVKQGITHE